MHHSRFSSSRSNLADVFIADPNWADIIIIISFQHIFEIQQNGPWFSSENDRRMMQLRLDFKTVHRPMAKCEFLEQFIYYLKNLLSIV